METNNALPEARKASNRDEDKRDRTAELPVENTEEHQELIKKANEVANQTIDEGNEFEVQGKAAVPHVPVQKRGSTKWTDEAGVIQKELNDEEENARVAEPETPEYLKLHQEVLDGADPLEATLAYQNRETPKVAEGREVKTESSPRTRGLGQGTGTENVQKAATAPVENKNDR